MVTLRTFDSSVLSLIVLFTLYLDAHSRLERKFTQYRLFLDLVLLNMALICIDLITWLVNGVPGSQLRWIGYASNTLLFALEPMGLTMWILYANFQIFHDEIRIAKLNKYLSIPLIINGILSVLSIFNGYFFTLDDQNIYSRGDLYFLHLILCVILLLFPFPAIFKNKNDIPRKHFSSLLLFLIPITIGTTLQVLFYGVSYTWSGMMVSLLIVYLTIQDRESSTDFLTEVNNRKQLDHFIKNKINAGRKQQPFSIILIDLDHFKEINDEFGHDIGDEALQDAVKLLRDCLRPNDFLARFGGDEFLIVMDITTSEDLPKTIHRIKYCFEDFNQNNQKPYSLSFSYGSYLYDRDSKMDADQLIKYLDEMMYKDKERLYWLNEN